MEPLNLEEQIVRQKEKGCKSGSEIIREFLSVNSYYVVNHNYEKYLFKNGNIEPFTIKDYKWLEQTNDKIAKEALSLILRSERIIRNRIADLYSFHCRDNNVDFFSIESFVVDRADYPGVSTQEEKIKLKKILLTNALNCIKKEKRLNPKYRFNRINDVPPFVIAQHLTFGQIRTFFKLLKKTIKEEIVRGFQLKISEFSSIIEKLNYLRNACAHGEFILDFKTLKGSKIKNKIYHKYIYNNKFDLKYKKISLIPILSLCSYLLNDNIRFFVSTMRNILEIAECKINLSINTNKLYHKMGLKTNPKSVQRIFAKIKKK